MNIKDVPLQKVIESGDNDLLRLIFARQWELMKKYHEIEERNGLLISADIPVDLDCRFGQARLKDLAWRAVEELGEAMSCLKNKPWKQTHMATDVTHLREELSDALHFIIEIYITIGLSPDDMYSDYMRKSEVNKFRQRSNY